MLHAEKGARFRIIFGGYRLLDPLVVHAVFESEPAQRPPGTLANQVRVVLDHGFRPFLVSCSPDSLAAFGISTTFLPPHVHAGVTMTPFTISHGSAATSCHFAGQL
jgi:hypothetical protein